MSRILLSLNLAGALIAAVAAPTLRALPESIAAAALMLEPVALISLALLCWLRHRIAGRAPIAQWLLGIAVPALVCMVLSLLLRQDAGDGPAAMSLRALLDAALAAAAAAALISWFRWRALALSPSHAEARLQALQARIRPHFLFNSLNTVLGQIRRDPRAAEETLENLADLFRVFMRDTRELVAFADELATCRQYLAIEQVRLGEAMRVDWDVQAMPDHVLVPALLLQPLIENAIHHGVGSGAGVITIRIGSRAGRVRVLIENPVIATPDRAPGNQMALSNIRERLTLLYDTDADLRTVEQHGRFTLLLEFPCRLERRRRHA